MTRRYVTWASRRVRRTVVMGLLIFLALTLVVFPRVDRDLACHELDSLTSWVPPAPGFWFEFRPSFQQAMHLRSLTERCYGWTPLRWHGPTY